MSRPPETYRHAGIVFLREQDGETERDLKESLSALFKRLQAVERAYLAVVQYVGVERTHVALCLRMLPSVDPKAIVESASATFSKTFRPDQSLDILPLTAAQEIDALTVCRPFYTRFDGANPSTGVSHECQPSG